MDNNELIAQVACEENIHKQILSQLNNDINNGSSGIQMQIQESIEAFHANKIDEFILCEIKKALLNSGDTRALVFADDEIVKAFIQYKEHGEIVTCKDCYKRNTSWCPVGDWTGPDNDFFCSYGERKDGVT